MDVNVYVEIEKHSNQKYEWDKQTSSLQLDRILKYPYFYPYSYGFIPGTRSEDGDETDVLIVSERADHKKGASYRCRIIGALLMEDEKGKDEKLLAIDAHDDTMRGVHDTSDLQSQVLENIRWFFSNYKKNDKGRWSKVDDFVDKEAAITLYEEARIRGMV
jgi:inorganic pyrophosphatase